MSTQAPLMQNEQNTLGAAIMCQHKLGSPSATAQVSTTTLKSNKHKTNNDNEPSWHCINIYTSHNKLLPLFVVLTTSMQSRQW